MFPIHFLLELKELRKQLVTETLISSSKVRPWNLFKRKFELSFFFILEETLYDSPFYRIGASPKNSFTELECLLEGFFLFRILRSGS